MPWIYDFSAYSDGAGPAEFTDWGGPVADAIVSGHWQCSVDWWFARIYTTAAQPSDDVIIVGGEVEWVGESGGQVNFYFGGNSDFSQWNTFEVRQTGTVDTGYDGGSAGSSGTGVPTAEDTPFTILFVVDRDAGTWEMFVNQDITGTPDETGTLSQVRRGDENVGLFANGNTTTRIAKWHAGNEASGSPLAGASVPAQGSVAGAIAWDGSVTGARSSNGATAGSIEWVGSVDGERSSAGSALGSIDWVGTVTGAAPVVAPAEGSVSGSIEWVGSVDGSAPVVGQSTGSISGSVEWVGSVDGERSSTGLASGSIEWVGSVDGSAPVVGQSTGSISGSVEWAGSVAGERSAEGAASGSVEWAGSVTGTSPAVGGASGSVAGAVAWVGFVDGERPSNGTLSGSIMWSGTTTSSRQSRGLLSGSITWVGSVDGSAVGPPVLIGGIVISSVVRLGSVSASTARLHSAVAAGSQ